MSKLSHVTLRLLGGFAIEANVGRPIPISVRSRKARALLAFLAMKPDYRASREELATLLWGDNPAALEPTREDRQRTALMLFARHEGREAALSRAKRLTDLLRSDLGVSPQAATRALIDAIKRGDFESAHAPTREQPAARSVVKLVSLPDRVPPSLPGEKAASVPAPAVLTAAPASHNTTPANPLFWRRWPLAAACAIIAFLAMGTIVGLGVASAPKLWSPQTDLQRSQALVVLPFAVDNSGQPDDPAFARVLTHNLIGYLSRFGKLRVISEQTSDFYRDRRMDVAHLMTDLGVQYAIVGRVQGTDSALRIAFQLV